MASWTDILGAVSGGVSSIANIGLGAANISAQKQMARENREMQREFAQNSIKWRVDDAKRSGIHPLYAIGAQGASYTPQSLDTFGYSQMADGARGVANAFSSYNVAKNQRLQNELLESQIEAQKLQNKEIRASMFQTQVSKQMDGLKIADVSTDKKKLPYGRGNEVQDESNYQRLPSNEPYGLVAIVPTKDSMDWYSEGILNQFQWHIRNSNPFRNPWTEADIGRFASEAAAAGAPIHELDVLQEWHPSTGWTMRLVPKVKKNDEPFLKRKFREFKDSMYSIGAGVKRPF